ncbi:MAG: peptide chain release factor N(5)-glutamine methyltransferase [Ignavibacteria bacterium]
MNETLKTWNILEILKVTENAFAEKGIRNPRLNAELLLSETTGYNRMNLYLNFEKPLTEAEVSDYRNKVKRRLKFEPLQYITGKTEFYGLSFNLTPDVLIPRQETEILVESVLEHIKSCNIPKPRILEIGTGSGCIAIAIAANSDCIIDAVDVSPEALKVAEENSMLNNLTDKTNFIQMDFLNSTEPFTGYDMIVSNPPYIAAQDIAGLDEEVNQFEPYIALTDSSDGLTFYKRIFELARTSENKPVIFLEMGDGKKDAIVKLLESFKIENYSIHNDLINMPRVLIIEGNK